MKKVIFLLSIFSFLSLQAFELEVDMGAGYHYSGASGDLVYTKEFWKDSTARIEHDSRATFYTWAEFSSDQQYWPNLRVELSSLDTEGRSFIHIDSTDTINTIIDALETPFASINNTFYDSRLVLNTYEGYLYYEYFEKSELPTVGFGLGLKKFDFAYSATIVDGLEFTDNGGDTVPLLFFKSRYELDKETDGTQLSFEADGKLFVFGDSNIYDYLLKLDFMMQYNQTTDLGVEIGYKETFYDIKGGDIDTVGGNMQTSGLFFGVVGHFR